MRVNNALTQRSKTIDAAVQRLVISVGVLVFFCFPKAEREKELLTRYHAEDVDPEAAPGPAPPELAAPLTT